VPDLQRALDALRNRWGPAAPPWSGPPRQRGVQRGPAALLRAAAIVARTPGSAAGMASSPSNSALKYSMVPPTSSGLRPRAWISPMSRVASATNMAAL
jgi:hypothetical protein